MVTRSESERRAILSRVAQAKIAIERLVDALGPTYEPSFGMALDRLTELRESLEQ